MSLLGNIFGGLEHLVGVNKPQPKPTAKPQPVQQKQQIGPRVNIQQLQSALSTRVAPPTAPPTVHVISALNRGLDKGMSWQDIANQTHIPLATVKQFSQTTRPNYGVKPGSSNISKVAGLVDRNVIQPAEQQVKGIVSIPSQLLHSPLAQGVKSAADLLPLATGKITNNPQAVKNAQIALSHNKLAAQKDAKHNVLTILNNPTGLMSESPVEDTGDLVKEIRTNAPNVRGSKGIPKLSMQQSRLPLDTQNLPDRPQNVLDASSKQIEPQPVDNVKGRGFINSVKNSNEVSEPTKAAVAGEYVPLSNKDLIANSQKLVSGGLSKATNKVISSLDQTAGRVTAQHISDAIAVAKTHEAAGNFDQASDIYNKLAKHATPAGQKIQALSLLSSRTPEGLHYSALKVLNKAGVNIDDALKSKIQGAIDGVKSTAAGSDERTVATQKLVKLVNNQIPRDKLAAGIGIWRAGLLTGPETLAKVAVSHGITTPFELASQVPSAIADRAISLVTGKRSTSATLRGSLTGAERGLNATKVKLATGIDLPHTGGFDETLGAGTHQTGYESTVGNLHGSLPKTAYSARYNVSLNDQALTEARNQGLKGAEKNDFVNKFVNQPPQKAIDLATKDAERATNQQETGLGKVAARLQGSGPIGKILVPFTRIPSAIGTNGIIDYTPLGLGKEIISQIRSGKLDQRSLSQAIGRSTTGTAVLGIGAALASNDRLTLSAPTDKKEKALWAAEGKTPNSIKLGDKWISLNALGPAGITIGLGGAFANGLKSSQGDIATATEKALASGGKLLADQPYFKGIAGLANAFNDPTNAGQTFFNDTVGSVIPAVSSQVARGTDPLQRTYPTSVAGKLGSEIPGLREKGTPLTDPYGQNLPGTGGSVLKDINGTVNPFYPSTARNQNDPVTNELQRLYTAQGSQSTNIGSPTTIHGVAVNKFTPQQVHDFEASSGPIIHQGIQNLINNPQYKSLTDEQKTNTINSAITAARQATQVITPGSTYLKSDKTGQSVLNAITTYAKAFKTSPSQAFKDLTTGQHILRAAGGGLIVQRAANKDTQALIKQRGGNPQNGTEVNLDHTIPLEIGGTNAVSNLKLVPKAVWQSYTPVEDFLGKQLSSGAINMKTAQQVIQDYKNGKISGQQAYNAAGGKGASSFTNQLYQPGITAAKKPSLLVSNTSSNPSSLGTGAIKISTKGKASLSSGSSSSGTTGGTDPKTTYTNAVNKYNQDKKAGKISDVQDITRSQSLKKLKAESTYDKNTVDLYGLTTKQINSYLLSNPNGGNIYKNLLNLDTSLSQAGFTPKLHDKYGRVKNINTGGTTASSGNTSTKSTKSSSKVAVSGVKVHPIKIAAIKLAKPKKSKSFKMKPLKAGRFSLAKPKKITVS